MTGEDAIIDLGVAKSAAGMWYMENKL